MLARMAALKVLTAALAGEVLEELRIPPGVQRVLFKTDNSARQAVQMT